jgi:hypothetical protein
MHRSIVLCLLFLVSCACANAQGPHPDTIRADSGKSRAVSDTTKVMSANTSVFHLHWRGIKAAIIGGAGGGIGGLLLGLVVFYIIDVFLRYCRRRLAF